MLNNKKGMMAAVLLSLGLFNMGCSQQKAPSFTPLKTVGSIEIYDDRALNLISADTPIEVVADGHTWTEGPLWIEEGQYLIYSDIPNNKIMKFDPQSGSELYLDKSGSTGWVEGDYGQGSNGLLLDKQGRLVAFQQGDRRVAVMDAPLSSPKSKFITLASEYQGKRLNSPNDGVYHQNGNLYFTDPPYGLKDIMRDSRKELPFQGVYLLKPNGELLLVDDELSYPNGIGLTVDQKNLVVAVSDSSNAHWAAYDVNPDGTLASKRVFYDANHLVNKAGEQGMPDGLVTHSSGIIFATGPGGVWLFDDKGTALAKIRTGELTANCTLTTDEKTLYMTADDYLMRVRLK